MRDVLREEKKFLQLHIFQESIPLTKGFLFENRSLLLLLVFFETTFLRYYLAFVRVTAFVGYKKNKLNWGKLERKKMNTI